MRKLWKRWWSKRGGDARDAEIREELEYHLDRRQELDAAGPQAARKQFGNVGQIHEEVRALHIPIWFESLWQDLSYAARGFRRAPGFTIAVVCALALGIGSSASVFSVVDRILFRPLPFADEDRLVWLGMAAPIEPNEWLLGPDFLDWRDRQTVFEKFASSQGQRNCDVTEGDAVRLQCGIVDSEFLSTFGIQPALGRAFTREDDQPSSAPVGIITHEIWQGRFGGDPGILNRYVEINGKKTRIAGVLPASFDWPMVSHVDLLLPMQMDEARQRQRQSMAIVNVFGRLKPGVSLQQATDSLQPLFQESLKQVPPQFRQEVKLRVTPFRERQVRDSKTVSLVLFGAVLTVLLVACANVANLMIARGVSREREMTVRAAIGAGRGRLLRQALTESVFLSCVAGVAGSALAWALLRAFQKLGAAGIPRLEQAQLDWRVLGFVLLACVASGVLSGIAPALRLPKAELLSKRAAGTRADWIRQSLVALQIGMSIVLLAGAGLLLRSLWNLQNVDLGLRSDHVLTTRVELNPERYRTPEQRHAFFLELQRRLSVLPGVEKLAMADSLPPHDRNMSMVFSRIEKEGVPPDNRAPTGGIVNARVVSASYFETLGIPIVRGRGFLPEDERDQAARQVILDQELASRLYPGGQDPVGRKIRPGMDGEWLTIVGVSRNARNGGLLGETLPEYYVVQRQIGRRSLSIAARTSRAPELLAPMVREEIRAIDSSIPVTVQTMNSQIVSLAAKPRFNAMLLMLFAGFAVALAAIGLAGVVSFLVAQRTSEIGVRMALGATAGSIRGMVLLQSMRWILAGAVAGIAGGLVAARWIKALLYGVAPNDPVTLAAVTATLMLIALAACWVPARRASRLDPMAALRHD